MKMEIQFKDVSYTYPDKTKAIDKINCKISKGEKIVMLGANGAGKSTFFMLLTGLIRPEQGKLTLDNKEYPISRKGLREIRKKIGLVFQNPEDQLFAMTVEQEVAFGAINLGLPIEEVKNRTVKALEEVNAVDLADRPLHNLSFGQKKRVSIADLLVMDVDILLLDEPTAWLDPENTADLTTLLNTLNRKGCTMICSTHDVNWAYSWADRLLLMKNGEIIYDGDIAAGLNQKALLENSGLNSPILVEISEMLKKRNLIADSAYPRHIGQLEWELNRINNSIFGKLSDNTLNNQNNILRMGYTTGSCAAAAAGSAVKMLLTNKVVNYFSLELPSKDNLTIQIYKPQIEKAKKVKCFVVKDAGDDPDITNGIKIYAEARFDSSISKNKKTETIVDTIDIEKAEKNVQVEIVIESSTGIGIVTRKGLPVEVGLPAINPQPLKQIMTAIKTAIEQSLKSDLSSCDLLNKNKKQIVIDISIPDGKEISRRTYNPRLGIVDGLSILGTTGLVRPMSEESWKEALFAELKVVKASGKKSVIFAFGQYGLAYLKKTDLYDEQSIVIISNFVGYMLEKAAETGFEQVILLGHIGKMIKVSAGVFYTHSSVADGRLETLTALSALAGADKDVLRQIYNSATTDAVVKILQENNLSEVFLMAADQAAKKAEMHVYNSLKVTAMFFDGKGNLLAKSANTNGGGFSNE